jgi:hypothetical protein
LSNPKILAGARFHLKDGRELRFVPVPNSLVRRRTGELLFAAALLLLGAVFLLSSLKSDNRRVRNVPPPSREESALR